MSWTAASFRDAVEGLKLTGIACQFSSKINYNLSIEEECVERKGNLNYKNKLSATKVGIPIGFPSPSFLFESKIGNLKSKIESLTATNFRQRVTRLGERLMQIKTSKT